MRFKVSGALEAKEGWVLIVGIVRPHVVNKVILVDDTTPPKLANRDDSSLLASFVEPVQEP